MTNHITVIFKVGLDIFFCAYSSPVKSTTSSLESINIYLNRQYALSFVLRIMTKIIKDNRGVVLFFLGLFSIFLIPVLDRTAFQWLTGLNSSLAILADLRISSLAIVTIIYMYVYKFYPIQNDVIDRKKLEKAIVISIIWIIMTAYFVLVKKVWVPALLNWVDYFAFMITGLLAEELLFRGALFNLCQSFFGSKAIARISVTVWITSLLFGLQHLGYHHFRIDASTITQIIYTIIMGIVFGNLRLVTGKVWPVILFHFITNSFTVIRSLGYFNNF